MSKAEDDAEEIKDEKKRKKEKCLIHTKIVVRRLPVGMNKVQFIDFFSPFPEHDFFRFVPGDKSLAPNNFGRAYINFSNVDDILLFRDKYDGSELEGKSGQKSVCVIEYAPFQKIPKKGRKKDDPKVDTIAKDADYIKFLESLQEEEEKQTIDIEKYLEELDLREKQNQKAVETPLTAFVKQRRDERKRLREERRKLDIERRKKKEEERRKKREAERKKRIEIEKNKRKEKNKEENDGKKTLGETKPEPQESGQSKKTSEHNNEDGSKLKILQKHDGKESSKRQQETLKKGVYSANELEESWAGDYTLEWPDLSQSEESSDRSHNLRYKENKHRPPSREYPPRRWKEEQRASSAKNKEPHDEAERKEDKIKNKKPDREIYQTGSTRGRGGFRGGRGSRPQKYSEQRNRSAKKGESDK